LAKVLVADLDRRIKTIEGMIEGQAGLRDGGEVNKVCCAARKRGQSSVC